MTGFSNAPMRCDEKNQREIKSGFEGLSGMVIIQICQTGNPLTFWPTT